MSLASWWISALAALALAGSAATTARYEGLQRRYDTVKEAVERALERHAPDLLARFKPVAPRPLPSGYGVLPPLVAAGAEAQEASTGSRYSWPATERYLRREEGALGEVEEKLGVLRQMEEADRRAVLEGILGEWPLMDRNIALIDEHVKHMLFWEKAVLAERPRFMALTALHEKVLERNELRGKAAALTPSQKARLQALEREISAFAATPQCAAPLTVSQAGENRVYGLTVVTDIEDRGFLERVRAAVERHWRMPGRQVRVRFDLKSPSALYAGQAVPARGTALNLAEHVARFPKGAAALTTGAQATHSTPCRAVVLGARPLTEAVLAHEFGHLLGFGDAYVRGFRDLGTDGLEILEIESDPRDIMSAPETGRVLPAHFAALDEMVKRAEPPSAVGTHTTKNSSAPKR